jgi:putative ABC transport system permease protein
MDSLLRDLRYGFRRVIATPGFTATAILTLALGIGANIAIFTVVNAVLLRPLPFPNPDRLVRIAADARATNGRNIGISQPELDDLRDRAGIFDGVTALWPVSASFVGGERPERIEVMVTSANYFQLLGAAPAARTRLRPRRRRARILRCSRDQRRPLAPCVRQLARR